MMSTTCVSPFVSCYSLLCVSFFLLILFQFPLPSSHVFFPLSPADHGSQTVEACVWWTGREPQQHKRCHVYTETLREVSYRLRRPRTTRYCWAWSGCAPLSPHGCVRTWFRRAPLITREHYKANIDLILYVQNSIATMGLPMHINKHDPRGCSPVGASMFCFMH